MRSNAAFFRWFLLWVGLIASSSGVATAEQTQTVFKVGVVPQFDARKLHSIWRPILNILEQRTGYKFVLKGAPAIPDFEREFQAGEFDFAYMNPYHVLVAKDSQGYIPLVKDTGRTLHGILVVRKDSPITSPEELKDTRVAFPAPNALGASLIIRADLNKLYGVEVVPYYVKTHSSVYLNVALGQVSAGGGVQKTLDQQPQQVRDALRILYETRKVAPHPFTAHPRVPSNIRNQVTEILLSLGEHSDTQALLEKIPIKKIGRASIGDYLPLGEMGLEKYYE